MSGPNRNRVHQRLALLICLLTAVLAVGMATGCNRYDRVPRATVSDTWEAGAPEERTGSRVASTEEPSSPRPAAADKRPHGSVDGGPIAMVNGRSVARHRVVDVLLRSHGVSLLEQLIALEAARGLAEVRGLEVSAVDFDREYDRALRRFVDPLSSITSGFFDRQQAERLLEAMLADRNMSREEFLVGVRRNAYLRALVESQLVLTEEQLRAEYERAFGERVQVRHIQLATPAQVSRVRDRLAAGADFADLADRYSANTASARVGGLLDPFSAHDEEVPELLREVAFSLEPDGVSSAIRIGSWYHLLKLEERIPAEDRDFAEVRDELERLARERLAGPAMERLYERLFREASIRIHDPVLREAFEKKHPDRESAN